MPSPSDEQALEAALEKRLTGTCLEELQAPSRLNRSRRWKTL